MAGRLKHGGEATGLPDDIVPEVRVAGFQILRTEIQHEEANSNLLIEAEKP